MCTGDSCLLWYMKLHEILLNKTLKNILLLCTCVTSESERLYCALSSATEPSVWITSVIWTTTVWTSVDFDAGFLVGWRATEGGASPKSVESKKTLSTHKRRLQILNYGFSVFCINWLETPAVYANRHFGALVTKEGMASGLNSMRLKRITVNLSLRVVEERRKSYNFDFPNRCSSDGFPFPSHLQKRATKSSLLPWTILESEKTHSGPIHVEDRGSVISS